LLMAGLAALSLGGCVTVFPKVKPVQLYHFGIQAQAPQAPVKADAAGVTVLSGPVTFNRAVAGDRILSVNGGQSAYLAGGRWTTPAVLMFEESLNNASKRPKMPNFNAGTRFYPAYPPHVCSS